MTPMLDFADFTEGHCYKHIRKIGEAAVLVNGWEISALTQIRGNDVTCRRTSTRADLGGQAHPVPCVGPWSLQTKCKIEAE